MYLETDGALKEVLFRNVDGAVVSFTAGSDGTWTPMKTAG